MDSDLVDRVSDQVLGRMKAEGLHPHDLPPPQSVVALVVPAQGVIDNGGLRYFFENDWPGQPPYSVFVDAYQVIGADPEARAIAEAAASFGVTHPERDRAARLAGLEAAVGNHLEKLEATLSSDVWQLLDAFVRRRLSEFDDDR